jgi:hypothetical protein
MRSSSFPSTPEAVSAALACSVYTVQPPDHCHAHSLLRLCSKVICVLSSFIPRTSASRVPESYQSYPTSPPTMPATHSAIPYSPEMHFPAQHLFQQITTVTIHSLLFPPVHCRHHLFAIVANCFRHCRLCLCLNCHLCHLCCLCCRSLPLVTAARSPSPEVELTKTLRKSLEGIPIVPKTHSVSFGYASLARYSYYIPCQY